MVSGDSEFVVLGLAVFLRHLNTCFDSLHASSQFFLQCIYAGPVRKVVNISVDL